MIAGVILMFFKNKMPMTNDSTILSIQFGVKGKEMKSPKAATINFIRQFARAYSSVEVTRCNQMILN